MMDTWAYRLAFDTHPATIRTMRKVAYCAAKVAGASENPARDIELAVDGILTDAAERASPGRFGSVEMDVELRDGQLSFYLQNHVGQPSGQTTIPRARPGQGDRALGLYIVGQLMDTVEVTPNRQGDGVAVRMIKRV